MHPTHSRAPRSQSSVRLQLRHLAARFHAGLAEESGQSMLEYALVAGMIGLGALACLHGLTNSVGVNFTAIGNALTSAA